MEQLESLQSRKKFIVITLVISLIIVIHFSGSLNASIIAPGSLTHYGYYNPPYGYYIPFYGNYLPPYDYYEAYLAQQGLLNNTIFGGYSYSPFSSFGYGGFSPFSGFGYAGFSPSSGFDITSYFDSSIFDSPFFTGLGYQAILANPYLLQLPIQTNNTGWFIP